MSESSRRYVAYALLCLSGFIAAFLVLELIGATHYYVENHGWFYLRNSHNVAKMSAKEEGEDPASRSVLHPYLGFVFRSGLSVSHVASADRLSRQLVGYSGPPPAWTHLKTNNHGFLASHDYPVVKSDARDYLVGIFGGSVAQWFALQGAQQLVDELSKSASFSGRRIKVLNFAQGGFKQPQQLQALAYMLALGQEFDLVVNIDGFNEIALAVINQDRALSVSMPSAQHILPLGALAQSTNPTLIEHVHEINTAQSRLQRLERWMSDTRFASIFMILSIFHGRALRTVESLNRTLQSLSASTDSEKLLSLVPATPAPGSSPLDEAFKIWLESASVMKDLAEGRGIPYLEVIQPNQYFSGKVLTDAERRIAINQESPFRVPVEQGYPFIESQVQCLRSRGVHVFSAVGLFNETSQPVFSDDCCHYNQTGNEILAVAVAGQIGRVLADPFPGSDQSPCVFDRSAKKP